MAYSTRTPSQHLRNASLSHPSSSSGSGHGSISGPSPVLLARIAEKKAELAHLRDLQLLSGALADQMQALETKLETLSDGAEAVAAVLSNWHNVLRAINLASTKLAKPNVAASSEEGAAAPPPLPETLVRIPTQHAGLFQQQVSSASGAAGSGAAAD